jgi:dihydroorotase
MARFGSLTDAPAGFVLLGARVVDPAASRDEIADLIVRDGLISTDAQGLAAVDAEGLIVGPGLCDLHTHLREPGDESAETIASGTRAAAHGGFTTVCAMPNTNPPLDEVARVAWVERLAVGASARVRIVAAATRGRGGEAMVEMGELAELRVVGFSDDGTALPNGALVRRVLSYLRPLGLPLIEHAEDPSLAAGTVMRAGPTAARLGLPGWPASAELTVVERDLALAAETGGRLHLTHLSTAASVDAVRRAKAAGIAVTCDVTPHHLALADTWVAGDRHFAWEDPELPAALSATLAYRGETRVNPPLASRTDALALLVGVADGTIDAIATDHAPHPPERTAVEFGDAAPGMIGLETALSSGMAAVDAGLLRLDRLLGALATSPSRLIGESRSLAPGSAADLVVFDPSAHWTVANLASASSNTPLLGMSLPGVVRLTVANGRMTYDDGMLERP